MGGAGAVLAKGLDELIKSLTELDLMQFLWAVSRDVVLPVGVTLFAIGGLLNAFQKIFRWLYPPPPHIRHKEIRRMYQDGYIQQALDEWNGMIKPKNEGGYGYTWYGPAYLCLACHEIYVMGTNSKLPTIKSTGVKRKQQFYKKKPLSEEYIKKQKDQQERIRTALIKNNYKSSLTTTTKKKETNGKGSTDSISYSPADFAVEGLKILQLAVRYKARGITKGQLQSMKLDAEAIMMGNIVMIDMNARLAKQNYLGLTTI